jgi:hypothetical protein
MYKLHEDENQRQFASNFLTVKSTLCGIGGLVQLLLLWCWIKNRKNPDHDKFALLIFVSDAMTGLAMQPFAITLLLSKDGFPGWYFGDIGMFLYGETVYFTHFNSLLSVILYTLQRYMVVCRQQSLDLTQCQKTMVALSCMAAGINAWSFFGDVNGYAVSASGAYVIINWTHRSIPNILAICIPLITACVAIHVILFSYYQIHIKMSHLKHKFLKTSRNRKDESIPDSLQQIAVSGVEDQNAKRQRIVLFRSVLIVTGYFVAWTPYTFLLIIQIASGTPCTPLADAICSFLIATNPLFNALVFFGTNRQYSTALKSLLQTIPFNVVYKCCG